MNDKNRKLLDGLSKDLNDHPQLSNAILLQTLAASEDPEITSLLKALLSFPRKFRHAIPQVVEEARSVIMNECIETLDDLVKTSSTSTLKGNIFDVIETGETWSVDGFKDGVLYCSPLKDPLTLCPFSLSTRIKNVF